MTISLDHQLFHARTAAIAGRAADLAERRDVITTAVDALLVDWRGAAAGAFSEAWLSWRAAADQVIASLATTADRLAATQADFVATDGAQAIDHGRLAARLGR
jgi:WXG100 family type VII secretion target